MSSTGDIVLLGVVMRLRQALSQPTAKAVHAALAAEGGVRYPIRRVISEDIFCLIDGIAEVRQPSLAAVKRACAWAHRIENGEEVVRGDTPLQDVNYYTTTTTGDHSIPTIATADILSEIAAHLQDTMTLNSLSRASKLAFEATAAERAPRKQEAEKTQREERAWRSAMEARHGKATPENMCPSRCPKCAEVNSWRLSFRGPSGPDMDMYADCQCSNPKCRHVWEAEA